MSPFLTTHSAASERICLRYEVARLDVFGSAARGDFDPERSDLDFLVSFCPDATNLENYLALAEGLNKRCSTAICDDARAANDHRVDVICHLMSRLAMSKAEPATRKLGFAISRAEAATALLGVGIGRTNAAISKWETAIGLMKAANSRGLLPPPDPLRRWIGFDSRDAGR